MSTKQPSKKPKTLLSFFKKSNDDGISNEHSILEVDTPQFNSQSHVQSVLVTIPQSNSTIVERDPALRSSICEIESLTKRDEVRRAYINLGPYQPKLAQYPKTLVGKQHRRFQAVWFQQFSWLEYSPTNDKAYCFPCYLFGEKSRSSGAQSTLTLEGFNSWKRINDGTKCAFLQHVGLTTSSHSKCEDCVRNLKNTPQHIDRVINSQSREEIFKNQMRLKASIQAVRYLALQAVGFRGHDESPSSLNRGNFIESLKFKAEGNDNLTRNILENAPQNAKYTSPKIQKEILHILANRVRNMIRDEIGDNKFCILVDESQDEAKREQMALVLRYVTYDGLIAERFFDIIGVESITTLCLKTEISNMLGRFNLAIQNLRGQGYDGASNMRGEWRGLQALFLKDCSSAYYVHCFAHQLQLALVAAAKDESNVWQFYSHLTCVVNLVAASPKRLCELKNAQKIEIEKMLVNGEWKTRTGANQIGTLHRPGDTRWSSHYDSVRDLINMYDAACLVVECIKKSGHQTLRGQAFGIFKTLKSFDFLFILHLMDKIMGITDGLCQALQRKSQDIMNAMKLVSTTKILLQKLRLEQRDTFLKTLLSFCDRHDIVVPNMNSPYKEGTSRSCQQRDDITVEHHYHYDIFNSTIDFQLMELGNRFNGAVVELLTLSSALDPSDFFKSFNVENICKLAKNYYPMDFSEQDIHALQCQLMHYQLDVKSDPRFENITTLGGLCQSLFVTRKFEIYYLIDKLIRLVLILPVTTVTTERAFSGMKYVKTAIRNAIGHEFLSDCMSLYLERDFAWKIDLDSVVKEFESVKTRRSQLS